MTSDNVMVPREPTQAMIEAGFQESERLNGNIPAIWEAMIRAAIASAPASTGEFRCHNCKLVVRDVICPARCPECRCRDFSALPPASAPASGEREQIVKRRRKPRDVTRWPPGTTEAEAEALIDKLCGCAGKWDCDCVSVFSQARSAAWDAHNTPPENGGGE
jgi:hypothetical protein